MVDGNLIALEKHLAEQEKSEVAFENFTEDVNDRLLGKLEDLVSEFNSVANNYGFTDYSFNDWMGDNL